FGIDKRKAHLSNLIFAGQITKEEALAALAKPICDPQQLADDYTFVLKKLGLSETEFEELMNRPPRAHTDFPCEESVYRRFPRLSPLRGPVRYVVDRISDR
ncbi:MAG TPA: hypothetical protein VM939_09040, partial [Gemmatimonadaceae bacterium]|nr:hypothetical protein [Gemmatimonadaceae bacterium]